MSGPQIRNERKREVGRTLMWWMSLSEEGRQRQTMERRRRSERAGVFGGGGKLFPGEQPVMFDGNFEYFPLLSFLFFRKGGNSLFFPFISVYVGVELGWSRMECDYQGWDGTCCARTESDG